MPAPGRWEPLAGVAAVIQPTFLDPELGRARFFPPGSCSVSSSRFLVFLLLLQGEKLNHLQLLVIDYLLCMLRVGSPEPNEHRDVAEAGASVR